MLNELDLPQIVEERTILAVIKDETPFPPHFMWFYLMSN